MSDKRGRKPIPAKHLTPPKPQAPEIIDEFETEPSEDELADMTKLDEMRAQFGGRQYTIRVERFNDQTSEMEIIDKFHFDTFDPFVLAKRYGGGRFVCSLFNDKSKYVEGGRFHYNFAKPKEEAKNLNPMADPVMQMFMQKMEANQAMMMKVFETALMGRPQSPVSELVGALKGMMDLAPKSEKENPLKMLKEVLELQNVIKDSADGEEKGEGVSGVMADVMTALKVFTESRNLPPRGPGGQAPLAPRPLRTFGNLPVISKPAENPKEEPAMSPAIKKILFYVPQFEEAAREAEDPEKWAGILLDILDVQVVPLLVKQFHGVVDTDGIWELLLKSAEDEEKVSKIFQVAPTLDPYKPWVISVIQAAVKQFDEDVDEPVVEVRENGGAQ